MMVVLAGSLTQIASTARPVTRPSHGGRGDTIVAAVDRSVPLHYCSILLLYVYIYN